MRKTILAVAVASLLGGAAFAEEVQLTATDSKCMDESGSNWNDNRYRAYWSGRHVDGVAKFDLSSIPDGAVITSMTLRTYHEEGFGNPHEDPQVRLYRTADDSWARGQTDPHPGLDEQLTDIHSGFPAGDLVPWDWEIDVNAVDWSTDLADDTLSILMRNEKTEYSYVYWYGSDVSPAPPVLTVVFDGNCLGMEVSTLVAGEMAQWDISNAGGGSSGVVVWGLTLGSTVVNGTFNYCASFGINGVNQNRVVGFWTANGSGDAQVMRRIPGNVSGLTVHTQAAQQGTCPEECMSDVDTQTIG